MPFRKDFAEVTRWQEHMLRKLPVDIRLGTEMDTDQIVDVGADAVIIATGSTPRRSGFSSLRPNVDALPGADLEHVMSVFDVFREPHRVGERVLIVDEDPHFSAAFVAEYLAGKGKQVEIVTAHVHVCAGLHLAFVPETHRRLRTAGVIVSTERLPIQITRDEMVTAGRHDGMERRHGPLDTVVLAMGNIAEDALHRELRGRLSDLQLIGDAMAPRLIEHAVMDGERAGRVA
jgi:hypothetical protein